MSPDESGPGPISKETETAHIVDEDVYVLELVGDAVEQALDGGSVLHVEREASDDAALAGRAFFVRCEGGLFHFFELGLAARGEDQGSAGASKGNGLQARSGFPSQWMSGGRRKRGRTTRFADGPAACTFSGAGTRGSLRLQLRFHPKPRSADADGERAQRGDS